MEKIFGWEGNSLCNGTTRYVSVEKYSIGFHWKTKYPLLHGLFYSGFEGTQEKAIEKTLSRLRESCHSFKGAWISENLENTMFTLQNDSEKYATVSSVNVTLRKSVEKHRSLTSKG